MARQSELGDCNIFGQFGTLPCRGLPAIWLAILGHFSAMVLGQFLILSQASQVSTLDDSGPYQGRGFVSGTQSLWVSSPHERFTIDSVHGFSSSGFSGAHAEQHAESPHLGRRSTTTWSHHEFGISSYRCDSKFDCRSACRKKCTLSLAPPSLRFLHHADLVHRMSW